MAGDFSICRPVSLSDAKPLVLGSASPRRRALLAELGLPLAFLSADIDEAPNAAESPGAYLERIVAAKLFAVADKLRGDAWAALLVADTIVVVDGAIVGKPEDAAQARQMVTRLCGRTHVVMTRYAIARPPESSAIIVARTVETRVSMRSATDREIARYVATGEGLDKAGAYAVQGLGAFLIESITGSYTNVVGLPVCEVIRDLVEHRVLDGFP